VLGEDPVPRDEADFAARLDTGRSEIAAAGAAVIHVVRSAAQAVAQARTGLAELDAPALAATRVAVEAELERLVAPGWVRSTPEAWFRQLPKYGQAALRRLRRLRSELTRDQRLAGQLEPWQRALEELEAGSPAGRADPRLVELRWTIEEFRLSLYAQELRTRAPVSAQRLDALLRAARRAATR
jgi:ATP-dependent helicase HrpA